MASEEVSSCVWVHSVYHFRVCIHTCGHARSYTHGDYTLPLDVTSENAMDAMYTVFWVSPYWNSPNQLHWLRRKPLICTSLWLSPALWLQACATRVCMGSEEGTQVLMRGKRKHCMTELSLCPLSLTKTYIEFSVTECDIAMPIPCPLEVPGMSAQCSLGLLSCFCTPACGPMCP